jgi:protein ImuA
VQLADKRVLGFGLPDLDVALGGGLATGVLHDLGAAAPLHLGAAAGFALTLAALAAGGKQVIWIQQDFAALEGGALYGPGLDLFGLPLTRLLLVRVARPVDVLWAMEEALKCRAVAAAVAELLDNSAVDLTATRRLSLAARAGGGLGLLLRHKPSPQPSASATRWEIGAAPGARDVYGGLGRTAFTLNLLRNRRGPCGRWTLQWDHHARAFVSPTLSVGLAAAAGDRPPAAFARAG